MNKIDAVIAYHNYLLRFWKILFTHRVYKSLFKIY